MVSLSSLPGEIQADIFLRLPVKSILTCKCVCKVWFSIISSPIFVKNHLDLSIQTIKPRLMFTGWRNNKSIYSIDYDSVASSSGEPMYNIGGAMVIDYPSKYKKHRYVNHYFGTCNGLICLGLTNLYGDGFYIIWNPATREHKELTPSHNISLTSKYGFGYDCKSHDYKLVKIGVKYCWTEILVYTLRSDSWKTIKTNPYRPFNTTGNTTNRYLAFNAVGNTCGMLFNGVLHWYGATISVTKNTFSNYILAFSISNEKLIHMPIPEETTPSTLHVNRSVGLWEGCLCLVNVIHYTRIHVWVMQNYGVKESWTKKLTIFQPAFIECCYPKLIWSHKDGEILIKTAYNFVLFNPTNKRVRNVHFDGIDDAVMDAVENYVESLVSPQGTSGR